jgi:hypothetical protein
MSRRKQVERGAVYHRGLFALQEKSRRGPYWRIYGRTDGAVLGMYYVNNSTLSASGVRERIPCAHLYDAMDRCCEGRVSSRPPAWPASALLASDPSRAKT